MSSEASMSPHPALPISSATVDGESATTPRKATKQETPPRVASAAGDETDEPRDASD